jgi:hypothetical protein
MGIISNKIELIITCYFGKIYSWSIMIAGRALIPTKGSIP